MESNKQWSQKNKTIFIAREIVRMNRSAKLRKSFDGSRILSDWFALKNMDELKTRKGKSILNSWKLVSMGKDVSEIFQIQKECKNAQEYLYKNKANIIKYWSTDIGHNDFLFTSMVFYLCKTGHQKQLDEMNIGYLDLYIEDGFKDNIENKYNEIISFMNFSEKNNAKIQDKIYQDKSLITTAMEQKITDYKNAFRENMKAMYFKFNFIKESQYKRVEGAHIVEVKEIKNNHQNNLEWIKNHNNGVYIEPNIHRMWDKYDIYLDIDYEFKTYENHKTIWKIRDEFKNVERTEFILLRKAIDFHKKGID